MGKYIRMTKPYLVLVTAFVLVSSHPESCK